VTATFGSVNSAINTQSTAIATLNGYAAARYSVTLDVNGYATGFSLFNGGTGVSTFTVVADKFQVAYPAAGYPAPIPILTVASVNGVPKIAFRADMIGDGSITTQHISTGTFSALWGNVDYLVGGYIRSPDSKMIFDLNNARIEVWS
jgi:hypothetical protein